MTDTLSPGFRAGLAVLVGRTNAGKSTLLNRLTGHRLAIVTPKPQTTREAVHGVVNRPRGQVVFVDTPGFFKTHASRRVDRLHEKAREALEDVEVVVQVVDPTRAPGEEDRMVREVLAGVSRPRILCLSKRDLARRPHREAWLAESPAPAAVVEVSGQTGEGAEELVERILDQLPVAEPLYPPDIPSNVHRTFQIGELVREQVYLQMDDEIPYRTEVVVDAVREAVSPAGRPRLEVDATVLAGQPRHQGMLIGIGGRRIREIRLAARRELERVMGMRVALDLEVRVDPRLDA